MLNMDFSLPLALTLREIPWSPSPAPGVERKRLEREAAESGHATSLVRYAAGSRFASHVHGGGEEFLVLEGTFSDDSGDFPSLTYVRNPIGSQHAPHSDEGCVIFVKLHQMRAAERTQTVVELRSDDPPERLLYEDAHERVRMLRMAAGSTLPLRNAELLLLDGDLALEGALSGGYSGLTWIRAPHDTELAARTEAGAHLWIKTGHQPA